MTPLRLASFAAAAPLVAAAALLVAAAPRSIAGTFALAASRAQTRATLVATPVAGRPLTSALDFWLTRGGDARPIAAYDTDMTKVVHAIVVRDDLRTFAHVHPALGRDGHFRIAFRFPTPGRYHVYADVVPTGIGQQVFRFDVRAGGGGASERGPELGRPATVVRAGPYDVAVDRTSLATTGESDVRVHVSRGGRPARDLHPYLGAAAHAVFLNARDLSYLHVHPLPASGPGATSAAMPDMPGMSMGRPLAPNASIGPDMTLHVAVRERGTYAAWLQFRGGRTLEVAPFVFVAR